MTRSAWVLAVVFSISCGGGPEAAEFSFPDAVAGDWKLVASEPVAAGAAPEEVRRLGLRSAWRGRYEGPGSLAITVYEMTTWGGAFELAQRWRPAEGRLAFYVGALFIVLESKGMDHAALSEVVESLEAALKSSRTGGLLDGNNGRRA